MFAKFLFYFVFLSAFAGPVRDYYEVLGVSKTATTNEIKKARKKLLLLYHPDLNKEDPETATKNYTEVENASEVLLDPNKRSRYDRFGDPRVNVSPSQHNTYSAVSPEASKQRFEQQARQYSNSKWKYNEVDGTYFDTRTGKILRPIYDPHSVKQSHFSYNPYGNTQPLFESPEGWIFDPRLGTYVGPRMGQAKFDPEDGMGWKIWDSLNRRYIPINEATGFPKSFVYAPKTSSDASALFDELFNPVRRSGSNRAVLIAKLNQLEWNAAQKTDFAERAV